MVMDAIIEAFKAKKSVNLINYCNTARNFGELFPAKEFSFKGYNYTHFLYLDREEGVMFLQDFINFIFQYYNAEVFSYDIFFDVLREFEKYLDENNVFFYNKTKMGMEICTNYKSLYACLQSVFGAQNFVQDGKRVAFNKIIATSSEYNFEFFNYLQEKLNGYNINSFVVEKLSQESLEHMRGFFKGNKYCNKIPFFLDNNASEFKAYKSIMISHLFDCDDTFYAISALNKDIIGLVIAHVAGGKCELTIIVDYDFYDTNLHEALDFIYYDIFTNSDIAKITTINNNKGMAFSAINSALSISKFSPDYSLDSLNNGYSQIKYELSRSDFEEYVTPVLNKNNIIFNF